MDTPSAGIHHVTAISGDAQRNVDFYAGLLGLRLVKRTVNFDDPETYHLYYGDALGRPGTILTFFPWGDDSPRGRPGPGQVTGISLAVPEGSLGGWAVRLARAGVEFAGEPGPGVSGTLSFRDPDGIALTLVEEGDAGEAWAGSPVPAADAIRGLHGVTLLEGDAGPTAGFAEALLGFARSPAGAGGRTLEAPGTAPGRRVTVRAAGAGVTRGAMGRGAVHHVAFRAADDAAQAVLGARAEALGARVTPVRDRNYFRSIYFREPGGVLYEVATDPPGFGVDESPEGLGAELRLPAWLEPRRHRLERVLPPLRVPGAAAP